MKRKDLTKTFMMISNGKKPFGLQKYLSIVRVKTGNVLECLVSMYSINYQEDYVTVIIPHFDSFKYNFNVFFFTFRTDSSGIVEDW